MASCFRITPQMNPPAPAPSNFQAELDRLAAEGDRLAENGQYDAAIAIYRQGFDLLPSPQNGNSALWFTVAIGDAQWFAKQHQAALNTWRDAIFYGGFGNPFVHLRRGQTLYELGDETEASSELLRALLLGGEDIFAREPIDYWVFITSLADPPEGYPGWIGWPGFPKDSEDYHRWSDPTDVYQFKQKGS